MLPFPLQLDHFHFHFSLLLSPSLDFFILHPVAQLIESSQHQVELLQLSPKMADKMEEQGSDVPSQDVRPSNSESSEVPEPMDMEETRDNEGATAGVDTEETTNNIELEQTNDVVESSEVVHSETEAALKTANQVF